LQAVEDRLQTEIEAVVGCRAVVGCGCVEADAQPGKLRRNLAEFPMGAMAMAMAAGATLLTGRDSQRRNNHHGAGNLRVDDLVKSRT